MYKMYHGDGQIFFRPSCPNSCPLGYLSPQIGCPALTAGGITVLLHLQIRKVQLPTGRPMFPLWMTSSISWLSRATGQTQLSIPDITSIQLLIDKRGNATKKLTFKNNTKLGAVHLAPHTDLVVR